MLATVKRRTSWVRLVVQDVHQPHNVSACIRSAEAFGIQDIDVVTLKTKFNPSTVARGVDQWVDIHKHESIETCVTDLHSKGYVIAAAFPHGDATPLESLPVDRPVALVLGNEHEGLDSSWRSLADVCFTIPMYGVVESMNISVCAAISMYALTHKARTTIDPESFYIGADRQASLLNKWICNQWPTWESQLEELRRRKSTMTV
jgi:tRNA (guanosine-2'-O-)-methyltransferase